MKYVIDNDLHIHSQLSSCSRDPEQTPRRILQYAKDNGLSTICLTDHFWDSSLEGASNWYAPQDFAHISASRPLPQAEGVRFLFGCETEMNRFHTIGISKRCMDEMDFIIVPTTHFHMKDYTLFAEQIASPQARAAAWVERLAYLLHQDLPFRKMGVAHLLCSLICRERPIFLETISALSDDTLHSLFRRAAEVGIGIELNSGDCTYADGEEEIVLRPFRTAKEEGCKFYCGSDAHKPADLDKAKARFQRVVDALELEESDKFRI